MAARNPEMDILKGLGIIFMVYGHANGPEHRFFYLFHMAIFVIPSGFFYKERYGQSLPAALDFIKRKLRTLYLPFVCFCLPFVLLNNFFIDINFYTNNEAYLALNDSPFAVLHEYCRPARLAKEALASLFFLALPQLGAALWFLRALLLVCLFHIVIDFFLQKTGWSAPRLLAAHAGIALLLLLIGPATQGARLSPGFFLAQACSMYWLFVFGRLAQRLPFATSLPGLVAVALLSFLALLRLYGAGEIELSQNVYSGRLFFMAGSIAGWVWVYALSRLIARRSGPARPAALVGANSLVILALHLACFKCVNIAQTHLLDLPPFMAAAFPTLRADHGWWAVYLLAGVALPLLGKKLAVRLIATAKRRFRA